MHSTLRELTFRSLGYGSRRVAIAVVVYSRWYRDIYKRRIWREPLAVHSARTGIKHARRVHLAEKRAYVKMDVLCWKHLEISGNVLMMMMKLAEDSGKENVYYSREGLSQNELSNVCDSDDLHAVDHDACLGVMNNLRNVLRIWDLGGSPTL